MKYWLMKSEPTSYSIDDLKRDGSTCWDGVRNFQARNFMRDEMKKGDRVLFYHSNTNPPAVVGLSEVVRSAYPDPTARDPDDPHYDPKASSENPRWFMVDIRFREKFAGPVSLERLKSTPGLEQMLVTQRSRLSVQPVRPEEFRIVSRLGKKAG